LPKKFLEGFGHISALQWGAFSRKRSPQKVYFLEQIWYMEGGGRSGDRGIFTEVCARQEIVQVCTEIAAFA